MSDMKCPICPICGGDLIKGKDFPWFYSCQSTNWKSDADEICELDDCAASVPVWETLQRTRKALEQSEICCTEWEKQALDYKAENIALSGDLECTRKALEFITRISGAGMSYQDMFLDAHEVAKFALGQIKYPVLIGRYDKEMTDLLRGGDNDR